jgi:hypothetical protein
MHYILTIILGLLISSCKGQNSFLDKRFETTTRILTSLKENQSGKILDYTYAGANNIDDKEIREHLIQRISTVINKYGIPDTSKWVISHKPNNQFERLVIVIPLFQGYDSTFNLENGGISITYPPQEISDKMTTLELIGKSRITPTSPLPTKQH